MLGGWSLGDRWKMVSLFNGSRKIRRIDSEAFVIRILVRRNLVTISVLTEIDELDVVIASSLRLVVVKFTLVTKRDHFKSLLALETFKTALSYIVQTKHVFLPHTKHSHK